MANEYKISIRSDENYEMLIAEIIFGSKKIGILISQERSIQQFEISVFSLIERSSERFYETEKVDEISLDLDKFLEAISDAKERLKRLDRPHA